MSFAWPFDRRRRRLHAAPFPDAWEGYLEALPFHVLLDAQEKQRLRERMRLLVTEKDWEGCGGLQMTDRIRVVIAAQAALLILNFVHDSYRRVTSILVYPAAFVDSHARGVSDGIVSEFPRPLVGQAAMLGPVVLSWEDAYEGGRDPTDGRNVVFHEFAHKLDMLDDFADGCPPLGSKTQYESWRRIVGQEFDALSRQAERGEKTLLDAYGATSPTEFFAVATECFFERASELQANRLALYDLLRSFYLQDPAARISRTRR